MAQLATRLGEQSLEPSGSPIPERIPKREPTQSPNISFRRLRRNRALFVWGGGPCTPRPDYRVYAVIVLYRNHRSRSRNEPKLEYITRPINTTLEQSFLPRNSIRKVGCCVLLLQHAVLVGLRQNPIFQADAVKIPGKQTRTTRRV